MRPPRNRISARSARYSSVITRTVESREFCRAFTPFAPDVCSEPRIFWFSCPSLRRKTGKSGTRGAADQLGPCSETSSVRSVTARRPYFRWKASGRFRSTGSSAPSSGTVFRIPFPELSTVKGWLLFIGRLSFNRFVSGVLGSSPGS